MKRSQLMLTFSALLAMLLLAGCTHTNEVRHNKPVVSRPHRMAHGPMMSVVGYEVRPVQRHGGAHRQSRFVYAPKPSQLSKGVIKAPRAVVRNPALWRNSGAAQPAVMQEKSVRRQPVPEEVIF